MGAAVEQILIERLFVALGAPVEAPVDPAVLGPLAAFADLVATWNARLNLTGAKEPEALAEVLFADAMMLRDEALLPQGARFVDVGAGAGAPSLPLLLLRPDLRATLVEPIHKRVAFLRTAIGTFDLAERATVIEGRLEAAPIAGAPFDVALSRATFEPAEWLARAEPLAPRTLVLVAGDPLPEREGARLLETRTYRLPRKDAPRAIGLYARG